MPTKAKTKEKHVDTDQLPPICPVEAALREYVAIYRARDHVKKVSKEHLGKPKANICETPLIGALDTSYLWSQMMPRMNAIEEMVRLEQTKTTVGAVFQLLLAARVSPVWSKITNDCSDKTINQVIDDNRKAIYEDGKVTSLIESALEFLLSQIDDPDIDYLVDEMGLKERFTVGQAFENIMSAVRDKPSGLHVVE